VVGATLPLIPHSSRDRVAHGRGAAPGPVTFFAPPKKVTKERGIPGSPPLPHEFVAVSLRCSTSPAVCATRAPTTQFQALQAGNYCGNASVCEARPVLAHDPAWLSENFQEGNYFRVWGYQLTGSYAAVPANGPAANESQPHPLAGLRCSAALRGPKIKIRHYFTTSIRHGG